MAVTIYANQSKGNTGSYTLSASEVKKYPKGNYVIVPISAGDYIYYSIDNSNWFRATYYNTPEIYDQELWLSAKHSGTIEVTQLAPNSVVASTN